MTTITQLTEKMITQAKGNRHDICHFLKVHSYAKIIGELENLDDDSLFILEAAAVVHDISCPLCREKYGSANGKYQEKESEPLVRDFLKNSGMTDRQTDRVVWLVCHHHTFENVTDIDHPILLEADYLVNADEHGWSTENIQNAKKTIFKTASGTKLLEAVYGV